MPDKHLGQVTPTKRALERDRYSAKALMPVFTGVPLTAIGATEIRSYIADRTAAGVQPGTLNKESGLMSAATNWANIELERRTFGSWLVQAGVGIERVSELIRHSDIQITARVYAHLRPGDLTEAAETLNQPRYKVSRLGFTFGNMNEQEEVQPAATS